MIRFENQFVKKMAFVEILTLFFSTLLGAMALNASVPAAVGTPLRDNSGKVMQHHHKAQGRFGGTALSPPKAICMCRDLKVSAEQENGRIFSF